MLFFSGIVNGVFANNAHVITPKLLYFSSILIYSWVEFLLFLCSLYITYISFSLYPHTHTHAKKKGNFSEKCSICWPVLTTEIMNVRSTNGVCHLSHLWVFIQFIIIIVFSMVVIFYAHKTNAHTIYVYVCVRVSTSKLSVFVIWIIFSIEIHIPKPLSAMKLIKFRAIFLEPDRVQELPLFTQKYLLCVCVFAQQKITTYYCTIIIHTWVRTSVW